MSNKQDELKKIAAEKKELAEKQKALREELKASAEERKAAQKARSEARASFQAAKSKLRKVLAESYTTLKDGTSEEIAAYADEITELNTELAGAARACSEALEKLEDL